jgi:hypothetical protein
MNHMNGIPTIVAVLPESPQNVPRYLTSCHLIVSMMTDNPNFPEPAPPLSEVTGELNKLATCEELARKGGKGMVPERDVALRRAHNKVTVLKAYVQSVANEDPEKAEATIHSAGMNVAKPRTRTKLPIQARLGDGHGRVVLDAKALPKPVQYRWQMSTDQETWTDHPGSPMRLPCNFS